MKVSVLALFPISCVASWMRTLMTLIDNDGGDLAALKETLAHAAIYGTINARKTLEAGFTTVREAGSLCYVDVALRDTINRGLIPGPRIHASGPVLGMTCVEILTLG